MTYESSDILGGRSLENDKLQQPSTFLKLPGLAALALLAWLAWFRVRVVFLKWKETRYKKSMRRRHGIPDEDERPFNVAYAAAVRARAREEEGGSAPGITGGRLRNALAEGQQGLRQRFNDVVQPIDTTSHWHNANLSIVPQFAHTYAQIKQQQNGVETDPLDFEARYNPNPPTIRVTDSNNEASSHPTAPFQQTSKQRLQTTNDHIRKRAFDDEDDLEPTKKSRLEGEELIDGGEAAEWAFKRGSKRGLTTEDDDEGYESTRGDKRPRNVPRDKIAEDQVMEEDEIDVAELKSIPRGKKRDRAEAGSTFGGDDDEIDGPLDGKASRSRKRKMISKRKSDAQAQARGRKRNRDADVSESEDEEDDKRLHISRKKRGKKGSDDDDGSDVSMNESLVSKGSYVKGRRIGEEWEVNGVLYKVGVNGQRLRQALVKRARNKFPMPKDSQHPDREANLEVYVETWLTEDEYKQAKEHHELAWQDTPKRSSEPEVPGDIQDSPSMKGKNLLWASAAAQESPAPKRRPFRESIATSVGLRIDAFPDIQTTSRRRVASAYNPSPQGGTVGSESPTRKGGFKTYSKWEKQDLEAEAMAKMKAKLQEQKKASSSDPKSLGLGAPPLVASASAPGPTNAGSPASFAFAKPADKPAPAPVAASVSLGVTPSTNAPAKPADAVRPSTFPFFVPPTNGGDSKSQPSTSSNKPSGGVPSSNTPSLPSFPVLPSSQPDPSKLASASPASSGSLKVPNFFGPNNGSSAAGPSMIPASSAPSAQSASAPATKASVSGFNTPMSGFPPAPTTTSSTSSPFSFSNNQAGKTASPFSFGAQPDPKKPEAEKPAQSSVSGGSLLGRIGGFATTQPTSQSFTVSSTTTPNGLSFSFGKTSVPEPAKPASLFSPSNTTNEPTKVTSVFNQSNTTSESPKSSDPSSTPQNRSTTNGPAINVPVPKFNFGFAKSPAPTPASGVSSSLAAAPEPSKATTSTFDFNALKPSASTSAPAESSVVSAAPPKFKLNTTNMSSGASPFGSMNSALTSTPTKPPFSGFGNTGSGSGTSNPFSTTPAASNHALPKSTFSFGNTGGNIPSTVNKLADATTITSSTSGAPASTSNNTPASSAFSFSFGNKASSSNSTAPSPFSAQPSTAPSYDGGTQSVFGKTPTPTPSAFGFGSGTFSGTGAFGGSGQSEQSQQEKK